MEEKISDLNSKVARVGLIKRRVPTLTLIIALVAILTTAVFYQLNRGYFPSDIRNQVKTALYYPTVPPASLSVDKASFKVPTPQVVTYTIDENGQPKYYVSIEPIPIGFDYSVFQKNFIKTEQFKVPGGDAVIGSLNTQLVAAIRTSDNSLVLINTNDLGSQNQLKGLCQSFRHTK